jgi:polyribonucleotide nucleotidyltransferase
MPALVHISQWAHHRVKDIHEVAADGMELDVLCTGRDAKGQVMLSRKALLKKPAPAEQRHRHHARPKAAAGGAGAAAAGGGGGSGGKGPAGEGGGGSKSGEAAG